MTCIFVYLHNTRLARSHEALTPLSACLTQDSTACVKLKLISFRNTSYPSLSYPAGLLTLIILPSWGKNHLLCFFCRSCSMTIFLSAQSSTWELRRGNTHNNRGLNLFSNAMTKANWLCLSLQADLVTRCNNVLNVKSVIISHVIHQNHLG